MVKRQTRRGGYRRKRTKRRTRRQRRGLAGNIAGLGGIAADDLLRGTGSLVGRVPIVGRPGRRILNTTGRVTSDILDLGGRSVDRATGFLTSPFRKLFRRGPRPSRRRRRKRRRRRTRRHHRRRR